MKRQGNCPFRARVGAGTCKGSAGFTLLELLVVLVLVGLISALLLQALQHVFRLQRHFGAEYFRTSQAAMQISWIRGTLNGLVPDFPDGKNKFKGDARSLTGLTLAPLTTSGASFSSFTLQMRYDTEQDATILEYGEGRNAPALHSWLGNSGRFRYIDQKGEVHDQWPPFIGLWPQLPTAIQIEMESPDTHVVVVAPKGPTVPLLRLREIERM